MFTSRKPGILCLYTFFNVILTNSISQYRNDLLYLLFNNNYLSVPKLFDYDKE